ncbi:hypothetical protein [Anaerococcus porci]|uniref:hypothetical protein n=1 Tax=Anaerococcus porci TaxID=2652269 RepID=UPI002A749534|nr:hypothetical protein [Anaerococcus porci]MDY3006559.1 hypothetical protein [Anaerococcus porci]
MKKIFIILSLVFLVSCTGKTKENSYSNNLSKNPVSSIKSSDDKKNKKNKKNNKLEYAYDYMDGYKRDKSLYVDRMLGDYPSDVNSNKDMAYEKEELKNLDYNKNLFISMYNIRIPNRALVFSNDDSYVIDFPESDDYEISIKIDKLFKDGDYSENELKEKLLEFSSKNTMDKAKDGKNITQPVVNLYSDYKNAAYSIIEDNKFSYTNMYVATPANIINFEIIENKEKSDDSSFIMSDLLSTSYPESEDVPIVSKSFKDYGDKINLYATKKINMGNFSFKIPADMENTQKSDLLTVFEKQVSGKTINQVIVSKIKKEENMTIKDAFNKSQGTSIPPSYITSMGKITEEKINDKTFLRSKARIYTEQFSLEGEKVVFEEGDYFVSMILTGPLKNTAKTILLNSNIINSLTFK